MKQYTFENFPYFCGEGSSEPVKVAADEGLIYDGDLKHSAGITRRGFLKMIAASGIMAAADSAGLFRWRGTLVKAWADESGNPTGTIYVFKRWEIPLVVNDVTDLTKKMKGATIEVKSLTKNKTAPTLTTNDEGFAILDARELGNENKNGTFSFAGSIKMRLAGYRTYEAGVDLLCTGKEVDIPTEPDDGNTYLQCASFDGWDIQYAKEPTFCVVPRNTAKHTFRVALAGADATNVKVAIVQADGHAIGTSTKPLEKNDDGSYSVEFEGTFLKKGDTAQVTVGSAVSIQISGAAKTSDNFTVKATVIFKEGVFDEGVTETSMLSNFFKFLLCWDPKRDAADPNLALEAPGIGEETGVTITLPDDVPVLGGEELVLPNIPGFPICFVVEPGGYYGLFCSSTMSLSPQGGIGGKPDWEFANLIDSFETADNTMKDYKNLMKSLNDRGSEVNRLKPQKFDATWEFSVTGMGGLFMRVVYDEDVPADFNTKYPGVDRFLNGGMGFRFNISLGFSVTFQFFPAGFFPVFIGFGIAFEANTAVDLDLWSHYQRSNGEFGPVGSVPKDGDLSSVKFNPSLNFSITGGVGLNSLASVSITATSTIAYLLSFYMFDPCKDAPPELTKPNPRHCVTVAFKISIACQLFMFKASVPIANDEGTIYDNWDTEGIQASSLKRTGGHCPRYFTSEDGLTLGEPGEGGLEGLKFSPKDFMVVDEAELRARSELKQVSSVALEQDPNVAGTVSGASEPVFERIVPASNDAPLGASLKAHPALKDCIIGMGEKAPLVQETLVYENVFSNPRMKMLTHGSDKYLLRILPVNLTGDAPRTRLTVAKYDAGQRTWGEPQVIKNGAFDWAGGRENLFDYDFAVSLSDPYEKVQPFIYDGSIRMVIISGTRTKSGGRQLQDGDLGLAADQTVLTLIELDWDFEVKKVISTKTFPGTANGKKTMVSMPFIDTYYATDPVVAANDSFCTCMAGAFVREADTEDALFTGNFEEWPVIWVDTVTPGSGQAKTYECTDFEPLRDPLTGDIQTHTTPLVTLTFAMGPASDAANAKEMAAHWFFSRANAGSPPVAMLWSCSYSALVDKKFEPIAFHAQTLNDVGCVQPWYDRVDHKSSKFSERRFTGFLTSCGDDDNPRLIRMAKQDGATAAENFYTFANKDMTLENKYPLQSFALADDGSTIYYSLTREGTVPGPEDVTGKKTPDLNVENFAVMAASCVIGEDGDYRFTMPYALCEVENPIDSLVAVEASDSFCFMASSITSLKDSSANIYFFTVPKILHVRATGFSSVNRFVCAGDKEPFSVVVRNDGNKIVSGFTLSIMLEDGTLVEDVFLDLTNPEVKPIQSPRDDIGVVDSEVKARRVEAAEAFASAASFAGEDDPHVGAVPMAGALVPTDERGFQFMWKVPAEWGGSDKDPNKNRVVNLQVQVKDGSVKLSDAPIATERDDPKLMMQGASVPNLAALVEPVGATVGTHANTGEELRHEPDIQKSVYQRQQDAGPGGDSDGPGGKPGDDVPGSPGGAKASTSKSKKKESPLDKDAKLPDTGDFFGVAAGLLAAAGLVSAGMAAYTKRRMAVEAGESVAAGEAEIIDVKPVEGDTE